MNDEILLRVDGQVERPRGFTFAELAAFDAEHQIEDVRRHGAKREGDAIMLNGILESVGVKPDGRYLGLHSERDNFHASIPLAPVRDRAFAIYRFRGRPLDAAAGGPLRFFVPDHASCRSDEIDECANVKFVERLEVTSERGFDNRPQDDEEHERLHRGA